MPSAKPAANEAPRRLARTLDVASGEGREELEIAAVDIAVGPQTLGQARDIGCFHGGRPPAQEADDDLLAILSQTDGRNRRSGCGQQDATRERHHQYMCWPPLMKSVEPVTKPASSGSRNITPGAISSALPSRPTGILAAIFSSTLAGTAATMSVSA